MNYAEKLGQQAKAAEKSIAAASAMVKNKALEK